MPATRTSASPDRIGHRPARQLARQLGAVTGRRRAVRLRTEPGPARPLYRLSRDARHRELPHRLGQRRADIARARCV